MDASNLWGQQHAAHPLVFQQQGQPTQQQQQALLEQHHRQATQQQSQRQAMAALSMQFMQPSGWGMNMPQHCTSAQTANQATGGATQVQQPWGMTMPQQCASAQTANQTTFGAMQAQQASAMSPTMTQQGAMTHTLLMQSAQLSGQQAHPNTTHFPTTTQTVQPLTNLLAPQQQHTTPTFNTTTTPSSPQSTTTAEALSLTHLAQNMDPTARRQLIQLLASHEPTMTSTGGSAAATLQQPQPPPQPPSQLSPPPQTQTHVPTATTDTMAVDAPRSEHKAPPSTRTHLDSCSPRRKHHHSRRSRAQRRRSRVTHSHSSTRRHRRQRRRRSSASSRRLSKRQLVRPHRSGRRPPSSRRSRSARHNRPGEGSPPTVPVKLRSRSQLASQHSHHMQRANGSGADQTFLLRQSANPSHLTQQSSFLRSFFAWPGSRHFRLIAARPLDMLPADNHLPHHQDAAHPQHHNALPHHHNAHIRSITVMKKKQNSLRHPFTCTASITTYQQAASYHHHTNKHRCLSKDFGVP